MRFDFTRASPQFGRRNTFLRGAIHAHGIPPCICIVRDLTPAGATLMVPPLSKVPHRFRLVIEAKGIDSLCGLVERSGENVVMVFI
jgi:hypothetical protein